MKIHAFNRHLLKSEPFSSLEEAIEKLKLPRHRNWFEKYGMVMRKQKLLFDCDHCNKAGCRICKRTGVISKMCDIPAFDKGGHLVKINKKL